jgi:hypothetical protein
MFFLEAFEQIWVVAGSSNGDHRLHVECFSSTFRSSRCSYFNDLMWSGLGVIGAFMSYLWLFWCYNKLIFYLNTPFILFLLWSLTFLFMFDQSSYSKY